MQVNKTNDIIGNFEFYLDSEYIIKDKICLIYENNTIT